MKTINIAIIDDENSILEIYDEIISDIKDYFLELNKFNSPEEFIKDFETKRSSDINYYDIIISDYDLKSKMHGIDLFNYFNDRRFSNAFFLVSSMLKEYQVTYPMERHKNLYYIDKVDNLASKLTSNIKKIISQVTAIF